jgi:rare lipoprotein A
MWMEPWTEIGAEFRGRWLIIAISLVIATAMFGCSAQHAPQNQYISPPPSSSSVAPPGRLEVASWYGKGFKGRLTSDGELYNPKELTAASKTLPIGSRVRVTNTENGRSVVVRINDRGPYVKGRSLDLSRSAARRIGMVKNGVCHVRVKKVGVSETVKRQRTKMRPPLYRPIWWIVG